MPNQALKENAKAIGHNVAANYIVLGLNAVISVIVAYSARANDVPLYYAIILGVAIFLALALGGYLISLIFLSRQHKTEQLNEAGVSKHEAGLGQDESEVKELIRQVKELERQKNTLQSEKEQQRTALDKLFAQNEQLRNNVEQEIKEKNRQLAIKDKQIAELRNELTHSKSPQVDIVYGDSPPYKRTYPHGDLIRVEYYIGVKSLIPIEDLRVELEGIDGEVTGQLHEENDEPPYKPTLAIEREQERLFHLASIVQPAGMHMTPSKIELHTNIKPPPSHICYIVARGSNTLPRKRRASFNFRAGGHVFRFHS